MKIPEGCTEPSTELDTSSSVSMEVDVSTANSKSPEPASSAPSTSMAGVMDSLPEDIAMSMMPSTMNSVSGYLYVYVWDDIYVYVCGMMSVNMTLT